MYFCFAVATPLAARSLLAFQVLHRSFAEPWGAEFHVATLRALLRSHGSRSFSEPLEPWISILCEAEAWAWNRYESFDDV